MKCPGQDTRFWKPDSVFEARCPSCGSEVEFFKDDTARRCPDCGNRFVNPNMDFGCASYCQYADQCLGDLPQEVLSKRDDMLKERVAVEVKRYFGKDFKRIGHAASVARYAEQIVKAEEGCPAVVLCAAYLHDIGFVGVEKALNSRAAQYHEKEGVTIARDILTAMGADQKLVEQVCDIVGRHHHPRNEESLDFKIVFDADLIVNLEQWQKEKTPEEEQLRQIVERSFLTKTGRRLARKNLLGGQDEDYEKDH